MKKKIQGPILVTGAAGFLGQALTEHLNSEFSSCRLYANSRRGKIEEGIPCKVDFLNRKAVHHLVEKIKPRLIFHTIGAPSSSSWSELTNSYIKTTLHLIEVLHKYVPSGILILPSSMTVYGLPVRPSGLIRERKSTRLNSSHEWISRMPSSA